MVAAVGGSLGSKRLNEAVIGLAELWAHRDRRGDLPRGGPARRVVGGASAAGARRRRAGDDGLCYVQVPYEDRMELFYQAADIVVARAGANTVAELAVVGVPAILVPLPGAPGDHQRANAAVLERVGAAVVLSDPECTGPAAGRPRSTRWRRTRAGSAPWARRRAPWGAPTRWRRWRRWPASHARAAAPATGVGPCPLSPDRRAGTARDVTLLDLSRPRRVHVVGAGGAGMSAIASVLAAMGHAVTGSDLKTSPALERLARERGEGLRGPRRRPRGRRRGGGACPRPSPRPTPRSPRPGGGAWRC